jgi:hypothetical protein
MQCYGLPFGVVGVMSNYLLYYTVFVLSTGNSPLRPWKALTHARLDLYLSWISLVGGVATSGLTLVRCRSYWQLLVIAGWKLCFAAFNGAFGVHIATLVRKGSKTSKAGLWSWKSYLPLGPKDNNDAAHEPLVEETARDREREKVEVTEKLETTWALIWALLCTFHDDYLKYGGKPDDVICQIFRA